MNIAGEPIKFETWPWSRVRIAAAGSHTLCVNAGEPVFAWGKNSYGQLGVGDDKKRVVPTLALEMDKHRGCWCVAVIRL